jgi:FkbM family methyltransferase
VNPDDERGRAMIATAGNVNPLSLVLWSQALSLSLWDTVVDVGANYGEMIVGAPIAPSSRVVAFEPNRAILPFLTKTCAASTLAIELVPLAVSDAVATSAEFYRNERWSGMSGLSPEKDSTTLVLDQVEVTTLDAHFADRNPANACIKIDVEGADLAVLDGAQEMLSKLAYWAVMIEILHLSIEQIVDLAQKCNFYLMDRRTHALVRLRSSDPSVIERMLNSGWLYPQDALLTSTHELVRH